MADIRELLLAAFEVEHREHVDAIRDALVRARAGADVDIREIFRRAHSLKGAARAVDLPEIEEAAHVMETRLGEAMDADGAIDKAGLDEIASLLDTVERHAAILYRRDDAVNTDLGAEPSQPAAAPASIEFLRVDAAQVQRLGVAMHELSANLDFLDHTTTLRDLAARSEALARLLERAPADRGREDTARLIQEARALSRGMAAASRQHRESSRTSVNAAARLREEIERVALVPASTVFVGLDAMIRDMAAEAGLRVDVQMTGLETRADRLLLQTLRDPVIHLLRNAIAHGLESPMERLAAGKSDTAQIGLTIRARAGRLDLSVFDDGRGPNLRRIEEVAIRRGLLHERAPGETPPSADRLLALVFEPGFSTAQTVDRIAGRGMGLSVVAETARGAGGGAYMLRRRPWGTEVLISTPLSAARQPVLLTYDGANGYGLPTRSVERVIHTTVADLELLDGRQVVKLQIDGNQVVVPVVSLSQVLGRAMQGSPSGEESNFVNIAVLRQGDQRLGIRVDAFDEVRTATVVALTHPDVDELVQGAMQLEQDRVVIVVSPEALMRRYARNELTLRAMPDAAAHKQKARRTILVVDDSVTTRTLEKSILEASGFTVILAVDGLDALDKLRGSTAVIDLIVADIEMPRMDGFQLLAALKSDTALASIPIIMMTSRADPADVRRGMDLGADAYLVKQTFDQTELLGAIGQLL